LSRRWQRTVQTLQSRRVQLHAALRRLQEQPWSRLWQRTVQTVQSRRVQLHAALRRLQEQPWSRLWQRTVQTLQLPRVAPRPLAEAANQPTVLMRRSPRAAPTAAIPNVQLRSAPRRLQGQLLGIRWQRTVQTVQSPGRLRRLPRRITSRLCWCSRSERAAAASGDHHARRRAGCSTNHGANLGNAPSRRCNRTEWLRDHWLRR
jgi:hypothetical protein